MLAIGRALLANPKLLLLDEPSHGLSPKLVDSIADIIMTINKERKTTILLVEQNVNVALSLASYGYVLENGRVCFEGFAKELGGNDYVRQLYLGDSG
jgi:branched-chain amino acid transport system ATP-binding protein